jgi:hypothetical protein
MRSIEGSLLSFARLKDRAIENGDKAAIGKIFEKLRSVLVRVVKHPKKGRNCMPAVAESLIGSWTLVAFEFEFEDGQRQAAYDDGKGSLIITLDGRFVAIVADNARAENDQPSVLFDRMMAYTGRYRLLVMIGIAPSTGGDALKIAIGGLIALAVIGYVAWQWKKFD